MAKHCHAKRNAYERRSVACSRYTSEHPRGPVRLDDLSRECALCRSPLGAVTTTGCFFRGLSAFRIHISNSSASSDALAGSRGRPDFPEVSRHIPDIGAAGCEECVSRSEAPYEADPSRRHALRLLSRLVFALRVPCTISR